MAKRQQRQSDGTDTEIDDVEVAEQVQPAAESSAVDAVVEQPSLDGLVKMARDGKVIHAHPTTVSEHIKNGWKPV